jgi:hypothetical protein
MTDRPNPSPRVKKGLRVFYLICGLLILPDIVGLRHAETSLDVVWGFFPLYGFVACVVLVICARGLRHLVMRDEDFYQRHEND